MTRTPYKFKDISHFGNVAELLEYLAEEGVNPSDALIGGHFSGPGNIRDDESTVVFTPIKEGKPS